MRSDVYLMTTKLNFVVYNKTHFQISFSYSQIILDNEQTDENRNMKQLGCFWRKIAWQMSWSSKRNCTQSNNFRQMRSTETKLMDIYSRHLKNLFIDSKLRNHGNKSSLHPYIIILWLVDLTQTLKTAITTIMCPPHEYFWTVKCTIQTTGKWS